MELKRLSKQTDVTLWRRGKTGAREEGRIPLKMDMHKAQRSNPRLPEMPPRRLYLLDRYPYSGECTVRDIMIFKF